MHTMICLYNQKQQQQQQCMELTVCDNAQNLSLTIESI